MTVDTVRGNIADAFAPCEGLAGILLAYADPGDSAHDVSHLIRVFSNVRAIHAVEGGQIAILAAACILHDCVSIEKDSPLRPQASRLAAEQATILLWDWPPEMRDGVAHAIEAHSFSAGIAPRTLEARILQDADRLDSLGAIGVARTFMVSGRLDRPLYDPEDPRAERRPLDDVRFSLDHFRVKLLHLADRFQTAEGARLARLRHERLARFLADFEEEIGLPPI